MSETVRSTVILVEFPRLRRRPRAITARRRMFWPGPAGPARGCALRPCARFAAIGDDTDSAAQHGLDRGEGQALDAGRQYQPVAARPDLLDIGREPTEADVVQAEQLSQPLQAVAIRPVSVERHNEVPRAPFFG